ncbi:MAG: peptidoglycan DD-metalloendopeptidase family protein [Candidatus Liptonbacteria bacterium]
MKILNVFLFKIITPFVLLVLLTSVFYFGQRGASGVAYAETKEELEQQIKSKSDELEKINKQLEDTRFNLESTKSERLTLQKQVSSLQANIRQLELNIKSDEITNQKLGLEINSLNYDIRDIEISVERKKETITKLLQEFQRNEDKNVLITFLKNTSLAESIMEVQSLTNIRSQLLTDIEGLNDLKDNLSGKIMQVSEKKQEVEARKKNLSARKNLVEDQQEEQKVILAQTKNKETVYQQQLSELQKQQDAVEEEIGKMEEKLKAAFDSSVLPSPGTKYFSWPIVLKKNGGVGIITQHYGEVSRLYKGRPHNGFDIGAPVGTPVYAAADGEVMAVDNNDKSRWGKYQYGKYVVIRHPNNLATLYGHLSSQSVTIGQKIERGQIIGYSGNTGYSTGAHLHLGLYWAPTITYKPVPPAAGLVPVGVTMDPESYL